MKPRLLPIVACALSLACATFAFAADAGLGPDHAAADREPVRLHRGAELAGGRVEGDDGKRVRRSQRQPVAGRLGGVDQGRERKQGQGKDGADHEGSSGVSRRSATAR